MSSDPEAAQREAELKRTSISLLWTRLAEPSPPPPLLLQAVAGLLADARSLADVAKEEASSFRSNYGYDIPLKVSVSERLAAGWTSSSLPLSLTDCVSLQHLADRVAMYVHAYTLYSAVRPFGCR